MKAVQFPTPLAPLESEERDSTHNLKEEHMRHGRPSWITGTVLIAFLALPAILAAQDSAAKHRHYTLVDVGPSGITDINSRGTGVGATTVYDPGCDCNAVHAIKWRNGVLTDLGTLPGGVNSAAGAINSQGAIFGQSENGLIDPVYGAPAFVATIWKDGKIKNLGTLGGGFSVPGVFADARPRDGCLNSRGQAVGAAANTNADPEGFATALIFSNSYGAVPGNQWHATLWQNGTIQDLGTLGDGPDSQAIFINERGQVAGNSYTDSVAGVYGIPTVHPFLWENGHMVDLGSLGGVYANVNGLNDRGQVVGFSTLTGEGFGHAFLWAHGAMQDLGVLGGSISFAEANAINDDGEIAGHSFTSDETVRGFRWKHGVMTDLGSVPGYDCSNTGSINASGEIAGWAYPCDQSSPDHAVLWEKGRPGVDLNTLVPPGSDLFLADAEFISDTGEITGVAFLPNGDEHAFLLIPKEHDDVADGAADGSQNDVVPVTQSSTNVTQAKLTPERLAELRARFANRHHRLGSTPPQKAN
jgi:probable HAF family extracellular repeat protein